tara:strand:- start:3827 stop:4402 length:576 start_codon:yes stop_codon:yes gene_type:complete
MKDDFKLSDEKLIALFQSGDINAYNELVERYKERLFNFVLRYFNNKEQAEDVVQDTLIKLYTHASYYKNVAKFSTWIFTIAKNNALTELRKNKRKRTESLWTEDGNPLDINSKEQSLDQKTHNEFAINQLNRFLDEIPENFRMAVVLRDFQELSYDEISKILEIPIGTIKSRINRGRIQLAEKMKHFKEQK